METLLARFSQAEVSIGTTTPLGGVQRLTERAGPARARDPHSQLGDELGKHGKIGPSQ
jgi:enoyl-CoA hydratase/carnithine racemase